MRSDYFRKSVFLFLHKIILPSDLSTRLQSDESGSIDELMSEISELYRKGKYQDSRKIISIAEGKLEDYRSRLDTYKSNISYREKGSEIDPI